MRATGPPFPPEAQRWIGMLAGAVANHKTNIPGSGAIRNALLRILFDFQARITAQRAGLHLLK